jgi:hypothetical protein
VPRRFTVSTRLETQDDASPGIERVQGRFSRLASFISQRLVFTLGDLTRAFGTVLRAGRAIVDASAEQEDAVISLDAALAGLGDRGAQISKALQDQAAALQQTTRFGDEAIIKNQALLAAFVKDEDVLKRATAATLDFAEGTGRDLSTAFELVSKAAGGQVSVLSRYGITVDESIPKTEQFAAALTRIEELFGGRAAARAKSFRGEIDQLSNAFGDTLEKIGDAVTHSEGFAAAISRLKGALEAAQPAIERLSQSVAVGLTNGLTTGVDAIEGFQIAMRNWRQEAQESSLTAGLLVTAVDLVTATYGSAFQAAAELARSTRELEATETAYIRQLAELEAKQEAVAASTDAVAASTERQADASARAAASVELLTKAEERAKRIKQEIADASKGFADEAERLGVVLDSKVNTAMDRNTAFLEQARELYSLGAISARELADAETAVAQANTELEASLEGTNVQLQNTKSNSDAATGALDETSRALAGVEDRAVRVNRVLEDTSRRLVQVRQFTVLSAL